MLNQAYIAEHLRASRLAPRPFPVSATLHVSQVVVRAAAAPFSARTFASIPPQAIAQFFPRSPPSDRFRTNYFPPLPRHWPASRQRWHRHTVRSPKTLRSYWLLQRAVQYR